MLVTVDSGLYDVMFWRTHEDGNRIRSNYRISAVNLNPQLSGKDKYTTIMHGCAVRHPSDAPSKAKGFRAALANALDKSRPVFGKSKRVCFWEKFLKEYGNKLP